MTENPLAAETLAEAIRNVARRAHSEEDVRVGVERALGATLQALKLTTTPEYEKTTVSGSADAVYGHVVIEYKRPGRMAQRGYPAVLARQLGRYLGDFAHRAGGRDKQVEALEKMIGIGLDGEQILFLRYSARGRKRESPLPLLTGTQLSFLPAEDRAGGFQMVGPVPVARESIELLLLYLRFLSRKPITPEALGADFGPQGDIAPTLVNLFYTALQTHRDHPRVATFFAEWDRIFGIVYGEELGKAQRDAPDLVALYRAVAGAELKPLLFAVHTYYALLMKLLAVELASLQAGALVGSVVGPLAAIDDYGLRRELSDLENGGTFALLGINNFLEGDFFGWYLDAWNDQLGDGIRALARELADYEPATGTLEPEYTRDLLKKLYQYLVPRKLRHDLGEYYTPDWLAERLLNQVGYKGQADKRLIDPGCGSGTFLILALRRLRQYASDHLISPDNVLDAALHNIMGFDLNPLSVIASRTNYLLALGDLLRHRHGPVELPVYMCDSILTPTEQAKFFGVGSYRLHTVVGNFDIPQETVLAGEMGALCGLLEACVRDQYAPQEFLARARQELSVREAMSESVLEGLYRQLYHLEAEGRNGLWARWLKNAFAPMLVGQFDFVVGNPPWVNWESLSPEYREATKGLWADYGLFSLRGHAARLGGGKKDLAMLFGFVITQTVFKTKGAGDGFRRFKLGDKGDDLRVLVVDDFSRLQPFEGATNRTAVMTCQRGQKTRYPVPYTLWHKGTGPARVDPDKSLKEVMAETVQTQPLAQPVDGKKLTSPWMTATRGALKALQKVIGPAAYRAREGSNSGGLNGVHWIRILAKRPDGLVLAQNLWDVGRHKVKRVEKPIEPNLAYPLLRGRDVSQWTAEPSAHLIVSQDPKTRMAYEEGWMKVELPLTYAYFKEFEKELWTRRSRSVRDLMKKSAFYAMYAVADYTFAPYKVVWREVAPGINAAVTSTHKSKHLGPKVVVPDHTLIMVPCQFENEAHFVCAILNSAPSRLVVKSYVALHPSPHVLQNIAVPEFDAGNPLHTRLAELSMLAHRLAASGEPEDLEALVEVEEQVDQAAAQLWGITEPEMREIRHSLEQLA